MGGGVSAPKTVEISRSFVLGVRTKRCGNCWQDVREKRTGCAGKSEHKLTAFKKRDLVFITSQQDFSSVELWKSFVGQSWG